MRGPAEAHDPQPFSRGQPRAVWLVPKGARVSRHGEGTVRSGDEHLTPLEAVAYQPYPLVPHLDHGSQPLPACSAGSGRQGRRSWLGEFNDGGHRSRVGGGFSTLKNQRAPGSDDGGDSCDEPGPAAPKVPRDVCESGAFACRILERDDRAGTGAPPRSRHGAQSLRACRPTPQPGRREGRRFGVGKAA